ncbi:hypothetical protein [Sutterella sp.]|uniref:autotransporter outer membrane beta-barrel domain-containing protein n=1 Tax=Sutterella sp. TaxID=1981025 RepID=UPI0026E02CD9|nr:hypothetical protein [Sutterella sp.]
MILAGVPAVTEAYTTVEVLGADGSVWARLLVADAEDNARDNLVTVTGAPVRAPTELEMQSVRDAVLYWSDVLGAPATVPEIYLVAQDVTRNNAEASPTVGNDAGETMLEICIRGSSECLRNVITADGVKPGTTLLFDNASEYRASQTLSLSPLAHTSLGFNLSAVMVHEFMHALGLVTFVKTNDDGTGTLSNYSVFSSKLYDLYGTQLTPDKTITAIARSDIDPNGTASDTVFYAINAGRVRSGVKFVGTNVTEVIGADTVIYYPEERIVTKDADGNWQLVAADRTNSVVGGIPVNGIESDENGRRLYEFSHLELQNSAMSHQNWRNWQTPLEAELAMLQDIGYEFDRKRFFGTSIYASGIDFTVTQAFTARENYAWTGAHSTQTGAVGVHVYGSLNNVTIAADQYADGTESFGVRVDGLLNDVTVASGVTITADGTDGTGIAFTYGRNHTLTLEAGSTVSASGTGGKALAFDFGGNMIGSTTQYIGSWITASNMYGTDWSNSSLSQGDAVRGALMDTVNISGTVSAPGATAIYISPNALVSKINFLEGASITGDIVSEWNARSTVEDDELHAKLSLGEGHHIEAILEFEDDQIPDITTEIRFGAVISDDDDESEAAAVSADGASTTSTTSAGTSNFSLTYTGNITGADGIRLTFESGTTTYSGTATVLGVVLGAGATVKGAGTYVLTAAASSESEAQARVSDSAFVQGTFVNSGKLFSTAATGMPTITGNYSQGDTGTLVLGFSSEGTVTPLTVSGTSSGTLAVALVPDLGYWADGTSVSVATAGLAATTSTDSGTAASVSLADEATLSAVSSTLAMTTATASDGTLTATVSRRANAYSNLLASSGSPATSGQQAVAAMLDAGAGNVTDTNARNLIAAIDYSDAAVGAAAIGELTGDAHLSSVRAQFALERLLDRTLARVPADAAVTGRHIWAQPFGGRLADNTAGAHSRTKAAGLAGGVTVTEPGRELGFNVAAAYFSESNSLYAKTRGQGLWLGASAAKSVDSADRWWFDLSGRIGFANVETERLQTVIGSSQEVKGTRLSATLSGKVGPRLELADVLSVRPSLGLTGTVLRTPSKTEDRFGGLSNDDAWYRSLRAAVGVSAETAPIASAVTGFSWKWTANAGYERELLSDAGEFTAGIAGMSGTFSQRVDWNDRNRWLIGGGLELVNQKGFTAAVRLEGELTHGDGAAVTGGAELRWQF